MKITRIKESLKHITVFTFLVEIVAVSNTNVRHHRHRQMTGVQLAL